MADLKCDSNIDSSFSDHSKFDCDGPTCWPVIIFVVIVIIIIICVACSNNITRHNKVWGAVLLILFLVVWALVLWFFCRAQSHTAAWFFLILPLGFLFIWWIASFLAAATSCGCGRSHGVC